MGVSRRALARHGLNLLALTPLAACLAAFADLTFWQYAAIYAAVGFYAGCSTVIDRHLGATP